MRRPASITCACGAVVGVKPRGRIPWQCGECAHSRKLAPNRGEAVPLIPPQFTYDTSDEREFGPEHPPAGMTAEEYARWKAARAVHLYRTEPELSVRVIAERLSLTPKHVTRLLREAGLSCQGDGRGELASGPPL
ncbi:MAG TPA: hypothetical protein VEZ71_22035 [Archangium sp.]|nr:hypothetical protein [Archangium sp.]